MTASTLSLTFPSVLSWSRPRASRGAMRYEGPYAAGRDGWALLARAAVLEAGWAPPVGSRYAVDVLIHGGGKRDIDRICTAVLDALQTAGVVHDDCMVDGLHAIRYPRRRGETSGDASTQVRVVVLDPPEGKPK